MFDAQTAPMNMNYAAIRKLMPEMLRGGLRKDKDGYYLIDASGLSDSEINAAPGKEFDEGLAAFIESHRRQRHTTSAVFIRGLEKALNEERAKSKSKESKPDNSQ